MRIISIVWLCGLLGLSQWLQAQDSPVYLPKVSSQYLLQARDGGARPLIVGYLDDQAYLQTPEGRQPFTQAAVLATLADPDQAPDQLLPPVRLEAERGLPLHYFQDLYFWLQLAGYTQLHFTVLEAADPYRKRYLALPIAPFFYPEQAYAYDAEQRGATAVTPLQMAQKVHPDTRELSSVQDPALRLRLLRPTLLSYVPQLSLVVEMDAQGRVTYEDQLSDPSILSSRVRSTLATHYKNSYQPAAPQMRLWLDLEAHPQATVQQYAELLTALHEGYQLYWEELAYNQHQKTYLELDPQARYTLSKAAPLLLLEYDPAFKKYWKEKLNTERLTLWQIQP